MTRHMGKEERVEEMSDAIHQAWVRHYVFWRDRKPHEWGEGYRPPFVPLGNEARNQLADTPYAKLEEKEKGKDRTIARYVLSVIGASEE